MERHARLVGTIVWRATGDDGVVEDLTQETFLRVFAALGSFGGRSKLSTWIGTIAHRLAVDHLRRMGTRPEVSWPATPAGPFEPAALGRERSRASGGAGRPGPPGP